MLGPRSRTPAASERLKDLVQVEGARDNQLIGYGLVAGLPGTGDQTTQVPYSVQAIQNMLRQLGLTLNPNAFIQPTAVASVIVTADLPNFMQIGQKLDVTVSALGNAKSLRGGVLLMTELRGADGQVYAIAQGSLLVSGFEASGQAASTTVNIPTVAHIPRGATIEKTPKAAFATTNMILLDLDSRSFGNAARIAEAINAHYGHLATALGPAQVGVRTPEAAGARVEFVADLLDVPVIPDEPSAEVAIDAQSGTVVMGEDVRIGPAAVAYGTLSVTVNELPQVSQPAPYQPRPHHGGAADPAAEQREKGSGRRIAQCTPGFRHRAQPECDRRHVIGFDGDFAGAAAGGRAAGAHQGALTWIWRPQSG